ncbi:LysR family transcriptional regulator [Serratia nevei]|uniref:LysR family transcriptional regulator n=1 Tax=Serratia nevei TaxID=2703794 RepID=UPI00313CD237
MNVIHEFSPYLGILALVEEKHFGKAAKHIHITQSAFSMQIKALEEEIGAQLFIRNNRNIELTEVGEAFLKIRRIFMRK